MKIQKLFIYAVPLAAIAIVFVLLFNNKGENKQEADNYSYSQDKQPVATVEPKETEKQPAMNIDKNKKYQATLKTTEGDITIDLNVSSTPITVNNFVTLAQKNFYDGTIFHRVIEGFMIQGGDPKGDGTGGPGYEFDDEPFTGNYDRGVIAMANRGPNTNGSQFFIMHQSNPLPKNYVIFGKVSKGIEVVDKIANAKTSMSPTGEMSKPVNPVKINKVEIITQ